MAAVAHSIRSIWGLAKSPQLHLSEEDLYALIFRETGKDSIKQLSQSQINDVVRVLQNLKDSVGGIKTTAKKRTDVGGQECTKALRRKIYMLTQELGWNDNGKRIHGFVKKLCSVERLEWLTTRQCHQVIEALKKMVERETATKS